MTSAPISASSLPGHWPGPGGTQVNDADAVQRRPAGSCRRQRSAAGVGFELGRAEFRKLGKDFGIVLPQQRGRALDCQRRAVQTDRRAGVAMPAGLGMVNLAEPMAGQQVGRFQRLVHGEHRGAGNPVFQAQPQDFVLVMLHKPGRNQAFGLFGIPVAHGAAVPVAGVVHPVGVAQQVEEPLVLLQLGRVDAHVAVATGQDAVGEEAEAHPVAGAGAGDAAIDEGGQMVAGQQGGDDAGIGKVDVLAGAVIAGRGAGQQGDDGSVGAADAGEVGRLLRGRGQRLAVDVAGTEAHAAEGVHLQVVAGVLPVVAGASVGRKGDGYQMGMPAGQGVGGDAGLIQGGVGPVLDENVGGIQQTVEGVDAGVCVSVQGYAAFALVDEEEQAAAFGMGNSVGIGAAPTGRVAVWRFHLDDVGAEFGQQPGAEWGGDHLAPLNDADALQGRGGQRGNGGG